MSSNIPAAPAYGVYISQLIRYSRACASYQDFIDRGLQLTRKLLSQGFLREKLQSSLRMFFGRHHDLVDRYEISISQITMDIFRLSWIKIRSYTYCDQHRLWLYPGFDYWVTRWVPLVEQELLTLPEHLNSPWFLYGSCYSSFSFQCSVVCSMFVFRFILLAMVLSVLDLTISVYPFGIFEFLLSNFS